MHILLIIRPLLSTLALSASLLGLAACGGGGSGAPGNAGNADGSAGTTIVAGNVADGDTGVDPRSPIRLTLSASVAGTGFTAGNIVFTAEGSPPVANAGTAARPAAFSPGIDVPLTMTVSGADLTIVPGAPLAYNTTHRITINLDGLTGGGSGLRGTVMLTFATRDGAWTMPELLDTHDAPAEHWSYLGRSLAVAPDGTAVAVWPRRVGTSNRVFARHYAPGTGWGPATNLADTGDSTDEPSVAMDDRGNAYVAWIRHGAPSITSPEGVREAWGAQLPAGGSWTPPTSLSGGNEGVTAVLVRSDGAGAVAVWHQSGANNELRSVRSDGGGWTAPVQISGLESLGGIRLGRIDRQPTGRVRVSWAGSPFGPEPVLEELYSSDQTAEGGWTAPYVSDVCSNTCVDRDIAYDPAGALFDVHNTSSGGDPDRRAIYATTPLSGTSESRVIDVIAHGHSERPRIVVDPAGNAVAVWSQVTNGTHRIWRNRYYAASGWTGATLHESGLPGAGMAPNIGIDRDNRLVTTWTLATDNGNGTWTIRVYASRFE